MNQWRQDLMSRIFHLYPVWLIVRYALMNYCVLISWKESKSFLQNFKSWFSYTQYRAIYCYDNWYIYVYIYVYIYICIYLCVYIYIYMYVHIYVHIYLYAQVIFLYFHGFIDIDIEGQYKDQQLLFKNQTIVKSCQKLQECKV